MPLPTLAEAEALTDTVGTLQAGGGRQPPVGCEEQ